MPALIESNLFTLDRAEATTSWLNNGFTTAPATVDDPRIEGSFCLQARVSNTTAWASFSTGTNYINLTDGKRIFFWYNNTCPASTDTTVRGGIGMWVSSDSTISIVGTTPNNGPANSANWFVDGKDGNPFGGWTCFVYNPNISGTLWLGTPLLTGIRQIGIRNKTTSAVATSTRNIMFDVLRMGTGLTISQGTQDTPVTLSEIYNTGILQSTMYGVLSKRNDIYYLNAKLYMGKPNQPSLTYFLDTEQTVVYPDFPVGNDFYEISLYGNTGLLKTTFQLGGYDGVNTSSGCTFKGAGRAMWSPLVRDNNSSFKVYGSILSEIRTGIFNSGSEIRNTSINSSGPLITSGCTLSGCIFNASTGLASLYIYSPTEINKISDCTFNNCKGGLSIFNTGIYPLNRCTFNSNTYDIINASAGQVTINVLNGGNASTYNNINGGTTTINNLVTLTLTSIIVGSEIRIFTVGTTTELGGIESVGGTTFEYQYNYSPGQNVDIVVFKEDYNYYRVSNYSLSSTNASLPISQIFDRVYSNP